MGLACVVEVPLVPRVAEMYLQRKKKQNLKNNLNLSSSLSYVIELLSMATIVWLQLQQIYKKELELKLWSKFKRFKV